MEQNELYEVLEMLEHAGLTPMICNRSIHLSSCAVRCGIPVPSGDDTPDGQIMLPAELVGHQPELFVPARGDSMIDAGFDEGDLLRVRLNMNVHDGDIVVASIDGATTVKVLFTDETGRRWLVPRNDNYDAIELKKGDNIRMLGVVIGVEKQTVRATSSECMKVIRRTLEHLRGPVVPTDDITDAVIAEIAPMVANGRQWYAVYRALADGMAIGEGCFRMFCSRVAEVVPDHGHLPIAKELGRLAVLSFRKRVALWDETDAPVGGSCFAAYLHIAKSTQALLRTKMAGRHATNVTIPFSTYPITLAASPFFGVMPLCLYSVRV